MINFEKRNAKDPIDPKSESVFKELFICSISSSTKTELIPPPVNMSQVHKIISVPATRKKIKNRLKFKSFSGRWREQQHHPADPNNGMGVHYWNHRGH
jgi:hypothetical protein